uniref:Odorant receptor n=1 Tax=Dendroctonus ponderosae TaxID=77166 RepID=R9PSP1_DENPD
MAKTLSFIQLSKFYLLLSGLWPFKISDNFLVDKIYRIYTLCQICYYLCVIFGLLVNLVILIIRFDQPQRIIGDINLFIIVFECCLKVVIFQIGKVPFMLNQITQFEDSMEASGDAEVKDYYAKDAIYCRRINVIQSIATIIACASFAQDSVVTFITSDDMSVFKDNPFMHDLWYPFNREDYIYLVICIAFICDMQGLVCNAACQTTLLCLMIYARTRLKILQIRLRKFDKIAVEEYEGDVVRAVKDLIAEHQYLINFVKSLNDRTQHVLLLEFMLNSLCLASGTSQFIIIDTTSGWLATVFLNLYVIVQIFILSWHANEISVEGLAVSDAIAASQWQKQSKEVQKLLIIMMMRAQKPIGLTAGPFFRMTNSTAVQTMKVAYSYASIMTQNMPE